MIWQGSTFLERRRVKEAGRSSCQHIIHTQIQVERALDPSLRYCSFGRAITEEAHF